MKAWKNYHKHHPKAVAFVLRGDSYMTSPIPEAEAKRLNVYQIFGWNDSVIDYMKFVLGQLRWFLLWGVSISSKWTVSF